MSPLLSRHPRVYFGYRILRVFRFLWVFGLLFL